MKYVIVILLAITTTVFAESKKMICKLNTTFGGATFEAEFDAQDFARIGESRTFDKHKFRIDVSHGSQGLLYMEIHDVATGGLAMIDFFNNPIPLAFSEEKALILTLETNGAARYSYMKCWVENQ